MKILDPYVGHHNPRCCSLDFHNLVEIAVASSGKWVVGSWMRDEKRNLEVGGVYPDHDHDRLLELMVSSV
jgi:hypothetical protein